MELLNIKKKKIKAAEEIQADTTMDDFIDWLFFTGFEI